MKAKDIILASMRVANHPCPHAVFPAPTADALWLMSALVTWPAADGRILSERYCLLPGDLRDAGGLLEALQGSGFDPAAPTLVLAECVLVYMEVLLPMPQTLVLAECSLVYIEVLLPMT